MDTIKFKQASSASTPKHEKKLVTFNNQARSGQIVREEEDQNRKLVFMMSDEVIWYKKMHHLY